MKLHPFSDRGGVEVQWKLRGSVISSKLETSVLLANLHADGSLYTGS